MHRYLNILCLFFCSGLFAQETLFNFNQDWLWEKGTPFISNYFADDYKASVQNWCFLHAENGFMYIGNTNGVLEYDGVTWRLIKLSNNGLVRSLVRDKNGKIFVGGVGDFGFLTTDSIGKMKFQSLLPEVDSTKHDFADIWNSIALNESVYFITRKYVFEWNGSRIRTWKPVNSFLGAYVIRNELFVEDKDVGIKKLTGDSLSLIQGGDYFNHAKGLVRNMLPYPGNRILVFHSLEGLFLYDGHKITPFTKGESSQLKDLSIYTAVVQPNGSYLLGSLGHGLYVMDDEGHLKLHLTKKAIVGDVIYSIYVDKGGAAWLGTNNGISRVEFASPLRKFEDHNALTERVEDAAWHRNRFYVGTDKGLYFLSNQLQRSEVNENEFRKVPGIYSRIRMLIPFGSDLIVAAQDSMYRVDKNFQIHEFKLHEGTATTAQLSKINPERFYIGTVEGYLLAFKKDDWKIKPILKIEGEIHSVQEDRNGSLWLSTPYNGLYKVNWKGNDFNNYSLIHYDTTSGLPSMNFNFVYASNNKTYITTFHSIFSFDSSNQTFKPAITLLNQFDNDVDAFGDMLIQENGDFWQTVKAGYENRVYHTQNNRLKEMKYSRMFSDFETYTIKKFGRFLFFLGPKGIISYNQGMDKSSPTSPAVYIREVVVNNDSVIFGGSDPVQRTKGIRLHFKKNTIRFTYALPFFEMPKANQYQTYLEGFDNGWSEWSKETERDFTNLFEGDYVFHVRAKNIYGAISKEDTYSFTVIPPLYRTWWAYLLYGLALAGLGALFIQWRSAKHKREKIALEAIITDRTGQIAKQAEQLQELDRQKSRFFANISHEFRTPLTLIKGPADEALQKADGSISKEDTRMIRDNSNRLLRLVNQLLDLSKLEAGKLKLTNESGEVTEFLGAITSAFISYAENLQIKYNIQLPNRELVASTDFDKLEKIINNILSNAFKFSENGGAVNFKAEYDQNTMYLQVSDSGIGMEPEQLQSIFKRFYQVEDPSTKTREGAGIGLALTSELVNLMGGKIDVESAKGKGSTFKIEIPLQEIDGSHKFSLDRPEINRESYGMEMMSPVVPKTDLENESEIGNVLDTKPHLLIVEDHAEMRRFIGRPLQLDYQLSEAANGEQGLQKAREEIPDLVITDLMMPGMDGMALCHALKTDQLTSHIPVIMLTAKAGQEDKLEGLETGADAFLTKPFDAQELQVRVKKLIEQRKQLRQKYRKEAFINPGEITVTSLDEEFLRKLHDLIEENLSDSEFGVPQLQSELAMSKTQLHRKIKALTNEAPGEFLRNYRLKRAAQMIKAHSDTVTRIAYDTGFNNLSYFAKCFKELFGTAPSEYEKG